MPIKYPVTLLLIFAIVACKDDPVPSLYEGCCETEPIELSIDGLFNYYIPNIATPDADGINDYWLVFGTVGSHVKDLIITDRSGNTIYQDSTIAEVSSTFEGWDMHLDNGDVYLGLFEYSLMIVVPDGSLILVEGSSCSFICDPELPSSIINDASGCAFPSHNSGNGTGGTFDPSKDHMEQDCF